MVSVETEWRTPEEGKDFAYLKEYPIYSVPITKILSPKAVEIFEKYEGKKSAPLDEICEDIAAMVKETMLYNFEDSTLRSYGIYGEDQARHYAETMAPEQPHLLGTCKDGVSLGLALWKALGVKADASALSTTSSTGAPHAIIRVTLGGRDRLVNMASGSMPFGLIRNTQQLQRIGPPERTDVQLQLAQTEDQYGDPPEIVELDVTPGKEVVAFQVDPSILPAWADTLGEYVVNVDPKPEDKISGSLISLIKPQILSGMHAAPTPIELRKIWFPDVERKKRKLGSSVELCRRRLADTLDNEHNQK